MEQGINNVQIIAIGKRQYSSDNSNWTDDNTIPVVNDPSPNETWTNWGASQRDLFFLDSNGNYVEDFNITTWDYDAIYNTIIGLLTSGCTDPEACNYDETATEEDDSCEYPQAGYDCDGNLSVDGTIILDDYGISSIYPNSFNPITTISFSIPQSGLVSLKIYDITGKLTSTLKDEYMNVGYYNINWDASYSPSGIYFLKMMSDGFVQTQKVVLVK